MPIQQGTGRFGCGQAWSPIPGTSGVGVRRADRASKTDNDPVLEDVQVNADGGGCSRRGGVGRVQPGIDRSSVRTRRSRSPVKATERWVPSLIQMDEGVPLNDA